MRYVSEIPYEVKDGCICVTRCGMKYEHEKGRPFVGSALCEKCCSYRGKNKEKKIVYCASVLGGGLYSSISVQTDGRSHNKSVRCINDGKIFKSRREAAAHYGISASLVTKVIIERRKTYNGLMFEDYEG